MVQQTQGYSSKFLQETVGLLFLFVAVFLFLSLISYLLPLLQYGNGPQEPSANWCGAFGFFVAHYLFSIFGLAAFIPALVLCYTAVNFFFSWISLSRLPWVIPGISGILIASAGLLGITRPASIPVEYISAGGYLGTLIWHLLSRSFGNVGSVMLLALVLIFSLMATVRFSLLATLHWVCSTLLKGLILLGRTCKSMFVFNLPQRVEKAPEMKSAPPVKNRKKKEDTQQQIPVAPSPKLEEPIVREPVRVEPEEDEDFAVKPPKIGRYRLPTITLLDQNSQDDFKVSRDHYLETSKILTDKLLDFGVQGVVSGISPGPVVTTYEYAPAPGVKINKIVSLADDLAMVIKVDRVRIVGSIPGKAAIGIEIPNPQRKTVFIRDIFLSKEYRESKSMLSLALGFDVIGRPVVANLAKMPHLLIAGATGAGKSVAINAFIASILFKATPEDVRLLMIDPKRIELSVYDDIPHLLHPVVVEAKMASRALLWAVREMERRYKLLEEKRVKSFTSYNKVSDEKLPYIVIIVDELADLMMVASKDVETSIARLAQMARAAGMHIVLATQRPSVDVLTGLIKANFPTRISFKVSSKVDSRTVLDSSGAEHLLGMGDMLFLPPGAAKLQRIHGALITEQETERLIDFLKEQGTADYDDSVLESVEEEQENVSGGEEDYDEKYDEAVAVVTETGQASISMVQRRLRVGYNRAARMIETMEREGIVGPADGSRPREVLVRSGYEN
ncbi:DNA translocase FtsK [Desulfogranum japonicum]|uniref:DNA translocase FtsK n=1 Tax=Desulfogranum japonicum TaxID=231447 RepID=UPI0003FEB187|nr:DNA translocase FtsK [Desulfogranum japonicum]